jgi:hypothetical protein
MDTPRSLSRASASMSSFNAVYSRSGTPLKSMATTFGFARSIGGRSLSASVPTLAKKTVPWSRNISRPGKVSSSPCSAETGRNTFVPRFRPST